MIFDAIITTIFGVISFVFDLLPDIPPLPESIDTVLNWIEDTIISAINFLQYILSTEFLVLCTSLVLVLIFFTPIYHMSMFIYNKIRGA